MADKSGEDRINPGDVARLLYRYESSRGDSIAWQQDAQLMLRAGSHLIKAHSAALVADLDGVSSDIAAPYMIDMQIHRPALMLAAFAIELMLKALIIKRCPTATNIEHHNLARLARDAGLAAKIDQAILDKLTEFSTWKGRYPVTKADKASLNAAEKNKARVEAALKLPSVKLRDIRPEPGAKLPRALYDHSAALEDHGGTAAIQLFNAAEGIYGTIYDEWRK